MNKIEPNMYVRTRTGKIGIVQNFKFVNKEDEEKIVMVQFQDDFTPSIVDKVRISKTSHNIIDLIEEGDFVKVRIDGIFINYFMVDKFEDEDENIQLGIGCYEDGFLDTISEYRPLNTLEILGIVTKEQFSSMEYRLGE